MAIVTFWSDSKGATTQTSSALAIVTHMARVKNFKILFIDANFDDESIVRAYWKPQKQSRFLKELNKGKLDISAGAEGLVSAIASNKATPEVIPNFTKVIFKGNRLDLLPGLKTKDRLEFDDSIKHYEDLLINANRFYDFVFVDLMKTTENPIVPVLLDNSSIIMYTMSPNLLQIEKYPEALMTYPFLQKNNVIPILGRTNELSKYNPRNVAKKIKQRGGMAFIPENIRFAEATYEGSIAQYMLKFHMESKDPDEQFFIEGITDSIERILYKREELQIR